MFASRRYLLRFRVPSGKKRVEEWGHIGQGMTSFKFPLSFRGRVSTSSNDSISSGGSDSGDGGGGGGS